MGKRKKIKLSDMTTDGNSLTNYAKLFFLNSHCGLRATDIAEDDDDFARSVESQLSLEAKSLTCKYCSRVFHKRFVNCNLNCNCQSAPSCYIEILFTVVIDSDCLVT